MGVKEFVASIEAAAKSLARQFRRRKSAPPPRRRNLAPPELIRADPAEHAVQFSKSLLRDRIDAVIAHEHHESLRLSHPEAVDQAADTPLPIREGARRILRAILEREQGRERG